MNIDMQSPEIQRKNLRELFRPGLFNYISMLLNHLYEIEREFIMKFFGANFGSGFEEDYGPLI